MILTIFQNYKPSIKGV